jgi:hypothetical protein
MKQKRSGAGGRCGNSIGRSAPNFSSERPIPPVRRRFCRGGDCPGRKTRSRWRDQIRDPYLLEFLNLKDEYSESDLEEAIIRHLEWFLLELGAGFTFVARQKRIRIGDEWYRMDLLLYHRRLKCLVVIDLKLGKFTHADAGQMNLYLNYAREHLMEPGENEPVGLILCSAKDNAVVHYAMGGIKASVFASRYMTALPDEETLRNEVVTTKRILETRRRVASPEKGIASKSGNQRI